MLAEFWFNFKKMRSSELQAYVNMRFLIDVQNFHFERLKIGFRASHR